MYSHIFTLFYFFKNILIDDQELTGLARGGQRIKTCKETYVRSLDGLIKLASLQVFFSLSLLRNLSPYIEHVFIYF